MIKINIICVGSLKEKFWTEAEAEYAKRLSKFCNLRILEVDECVCGTIQNKEKEGEKILKHIIGGTLITLDKGGKQLTSEQLASFFQSLQNSGISKINFAIGGSDGLGKNVFSSANYSISFSTLTFPHQLFRIMTLEQIYRAFTILNNIKYHK